MGNLLYPQTHAETMMYLTTRLELKDGSNGTGFFFQFEIDGKYVPIMITNKHVVQYQNRTTVKFKIHTGDIQAQEIDDKSLNIDYDTDWHFHPTQDLCFCSVANLFDEIKTRTGREPIWVYLNKENIFNKQQLQTLDAIETVKMIGYPVGIWNELHNLPVIRSGITAGHPAVDFKKKGVGVVDMACFPGSSGSPIMIYDKSGYTDKMGNVHIGNDRFIFLGILFEGPSMLVNGQVVIAEQNNIYAQSNIMINLGHYIHAYEILEFEPIIRKLMK